MGCACSATNNKDKDPDTHKSPVILLNHRTDGELEKSKQDSLLRDNNLPLVEQNGDVCPGLHQQRAIKGQGQVIHTYGSNNDCLSGKVAIRHLESEDLQPIPAGGCQDLECDLDTRRYQSNVAGARLDSAETNDENDLHVSVPVQCEEQSGEVKQIEAMSDVFGSPQAPEDCSELMSNLELEADHDETKRAAHNCSSTDVNMSSSWADVETKYRDVSSKCAWYSETTDVQQTPDGVAIDSHQGLLKAKVSQEKELFGLENEHSYSENKREVAMRNGNDHIIKKNRNINQESGSRIAMNTDGTERVLSTAQDMALDAISSAYFEVSSEDIINSTLNSDVELTLKKITVPQKPVEDGNGEMRNIKCVTFEKARSPDGRNTLKDQPLDTNVDTITKAAEEVNINSVAEDEGISIRNYDSELLTKQPNDSRENDAHKSISDNCASFSIGTTHEYQKPTKRKIDTSLQDLQSYAEVILNEEIVDYKNHVNSDGSGHGCIKLVGQDVHPNSIGNEIDKSDTDCHGENNYNIGTSDSLKPSQQKHQLISNKDIESSSEIGNNNEEKTDDIDALSVGVVSSSTRVKLDLEKTYRISEEQLENLFKNCFQKANSEALNDKNEKLNTDKYTTDDVGTQSKLYVASLENQHQSKTYSKGSKTGQKTSVSTEPDDACVINEKIEDSKANNKSMLEKGDCDGRKKTKRCVISKSNIIQQNNSNNGDIMTHTYQRLSKKTLKKLLDQDVGKDDKQPSENTSQTLQMLRCIDSDSLRSKEKKICSSNSLRKPSPSAGSKKTNSKLANIHGSSPRASNPSPLSKSVAYYPVKDVSKQYKERNDSLTATHSMKQTRMPPSFEHKRISNAHATKYSTSSFVRVFPNGSP